MTSVNATVNKAHELIIDRYTRLLSKREHLKESLLERWPEDVYGVKWMSIYDERAAKLDAEIKLLKEYYHGFYDLIEVIEGKDVKGE